MLLRPATPDDFPAILALNARDVAVLSPLDPARLAHLHAQAASHTVVEAGGTVAAFLLAFREDADYDSPNFRWFQRALPRFLYIDRIVVAPEHRGRGLGRRLYEDLEARARGQVPHLACEVDTEPPNPVSLAFHAALGFQETGAQTLAGGAKRVVMLVKPCAPALGAGAAGPTPPAP